MSAGDPLWKSPTVRGLIVVAIGGVCTLGAGVVRAHGDDIATLQQGQSAERAWRDATDHRLDRLADELADLNHAIRKGTP